MAELATTPKFELVPQEPEKGSGHGPDSDLFASRVPQHLAQCTLFLLGILFIDQIILRAGDRLAASPFWTETEISRIAQSNDWDVLILGTCRAFFLPTPVLRKELGMRVLNAGVRTSRIVSMAFHLNIAKKSARGKHLILVVDHFILEETQSQALEEMKTLTQWQFRLDARDLESMNKRIGVPASTVALQRSGLFKYQGQSATLRLALLRWFRGQTAPPMPDHTGRDRYTPYLDDTLVVNASLGQNQLRLSTRTEFATRWLDSVVEEAVASGLRPVLVVPPVHRLFATGEVNADLLQTVQSLSARYKVPMLSYLDAETGWANQDELWAEVSHMNAKGVDVFTRRLTRDLKGLMQ